MIAFSVKCKTQEEGYSFARVAVRLGLKWANGDVFTANTNKWFESEDSTHYNVHSSMLECLHCITYGSFDEDIEYQVIPSSKLDTINNWYDVERIIEDI